MKKILILIILSGLLLPKIYAQPAVGDEVENFTLTDIDGTVYTLYDYLDAGQFVCIDFFQTTCNSCMDLVPDFNFTYTEYGCNSSDVVFLSIDSMHSDSEVTDFRTEFGTIYPLVSGIEGGGAAVFETWEIFYTPQLLLINPNHTIETILSPINSATIREAFDQAGINRTPCPPTAVENIEAPHISVAPNPTTTHFSLSYSQNILAIESIRIYTITGQLKQEVRDNFESPIAISSLNKGVYLVQIEGIGFSKTVKLIVQ